ncbi:fimbrial protein [Shewanella fidelis]|uniref:fimbrial protein n=1 Tax=Shewanella fidelis TaxID=173509 RepID=UPI00048E1B0C|nr:fimbrial protein [Shewanella fidelis]
MKLKQLIVSLSLASTCLLSANASANSGTIHFAGSITNTTCDIQIATNGVVSSDGIVYVGDYLKTDVDSYLAGSAGPFGAADTTDQGPLDVSLIPDPATCSPALAATDHFLSGADVTLSAMYTDAVNSNVITDGNTVNTNVGVQILLANGDAVLNQGTISLLEGANFDDDTGEVKFIVQPYAVAATVNPGPIKGTANFIVAYK